MLASEQGRIVVDGLDIYKVLGGNYGDVRNFKIPLLKNPLSILFLLFRADFI